MPNITVQLFPGRSVETRRELVAELTRTTCAVLGCSPAAVTVILQDVEPHNWGVGGDLFSDKLATKAASDGDAD
ncbi:4-oxalocrotonate tautomerase [Methylobrevis pamukkalensis]|uniref:Putative tautomerase n=1 Tax=Methylobrevis pamukkalensis TaxID=1439726 RepID=A0A1E3H591_9HYPH|nr:4-oxalocrotonate tautomerase [Methylobrevis pamukkalensis]ODN71315.1 putative tautomerase [Methylobrevis pamukkalensis]